MRKRSISKFKLHSIPILHRHLRYVSYSIPLMCGLALLLLISSLVVVDYNNGEVYAEEDIMTYATTSVNPTASLTIGGDATNKQVIASPGSTAYRSHTVTVDMNDVESYVLMLSGPTNLVSGVATVIGGSNGANPENMADNTWGYSWGGENKETAFYQPLSLAGSRLIGETMNGFKANFTKNLFFAAKFGEDAMSGRYTANVSLSLTVTPRAIAMGFGGVYDMQDMTRAVCQSVPVGTTGTLEDSRDGSLYRINKLGDGNCWMTENLKLTKEGMVANGQTAVLTSANSNVATSFTLPDSITRLSSTDFGSNDNYDFRNTAQVYNGSYEDALWRPGYGVYYSWYAATAGIGNGLVTTEANMADSICPKGWVLPTKDDYTTLLSAVGTSGATWQSSPYSFPLAGFVSYGGNGNIGTRGDYWTSTSYNWDAAYRLYIAADEVGLSYEYVWRHDGLPIRCMADMATTLADISTMQEMTTEICAKTPIGQHTSLRDTRDNSDYTVQKLSDGKCWMAQNLRIMNKTITPNDSDVASNYIIPSSSTTFNSNTVSYAYYDRDLINGALYNWCTATAGTCNSIKGVANASYSICPKGWKLPEDEAYINLVNNYGYSGWATTNIAGNSYKGYYIGKAPGAAFFPAAGSVSYGSHGHVGEEGYYWTSLSSSDAGAVMMQLNSGGVTPHRAEDIYRYYGFSVRCVAR